MEFGQPEQEVGVPKAIHGVEEHRPASCSCLLLRAGPRSDGLQVEGRIGRLGIEVRAAPSGRQTWVNRYAVACPYEAFMQVQLEKRAAELLIVVRTEPLPQVVIVRRVEAVSPGLHQLARVRPVLACHAIEE